MTKPAISVKNISKYYQIGQRQPYYSLRDGIVGAFKLDNLIKKKKKKGFWALKNITFDVMPGEVIGIIGKNGSGKSTLLKILSQITYPNTGSAVINGRLGSLLEVGTGFHPELTGRENIYLNGAILGMNRQEIKQKISRIIDFAEIHKFIDSPVKHYSSGMYVRLAFSVAAHLEPEILLIDEVLSVGDVVFQKKSLGKMKDVARQGRTVIFVSHSMGTIRNLCQKTILLDKGRIVGVGKPDKIIQQYISLMSDGDSGPTKKYSKKPKLEAQHNSISLVGESNKPTTILKLQEKSTAIVDYEIRRNLKNSDIGLMISQAGQPLWISLDTDANPNILLNRQAGKYKQAVDLPTHILMPGHYHLGPSMGYVGIGPIDRQSHNGIDFEITNIPKNSRQRIQSPKKGGVISYIKKWRQI